MFRKRTLFAYSVLVALPLLTLVFVLNAGRGLSTQVLSSLAHVKTSNPAPALDLFLLVMQVGIILLVSRLTGMLFKRIRQPQVVGEMVAGILLGPSLLGWLAPEWSHALFPAGGLGYLNALSQIGLVLFMFLVGVSIKPEELKHNGHAAVLTSNAGIVMPFCLGSALALFLFPRLAEPGVSFVNFALFMGSAMSITAFPVLARILTEKNLLSTRMGTLAISCAAVDDISGWCILAYIVTLVRAKAGSAPVAWIIGGALFYVVVMIVAVKPVLARFDRSFRRHGGLTENAVSVMILLALLSALITERLGVHLLFGAFLMGAIMPKTPEFVKSVVSKMESVTVVVLLPLFFAFSGLRTSVGMVRGNLWWIVALVIGVAVAGKFGGCALAARMSGISGRDAVSLGILMNTRGLMELIALNIGLDIGVISPTVFTIMVLMALATTFMTSPLLEWIYPPARKHVHGEARAEESLDGCLPQPS